MRSLAGSLRRLQTDRLDLLLLHRPDPLVEPEEVARAFDDLHRSRKVRYFGVSNHTAAQIELLRKHVRQPIVVNQVELSLPYPELLDEGVVFNQSKPVHAMRGADTLEYCRRHNITLQAWGPLAGGAGVTGGDGSSEASRRAAGVVAQLAKEKKVSPEAIALTWLLRHPAHSRRGLTPFPGETTSMFTVRALMDDDRDWIAQFIRAEWGAEFVVAHGVIYHPHTLPGCVAEQDGEIVGLLTYHLAGRQCEIVTLDSRRPGLGIGTALIAAVRRAAIEAGCARLWLITTNDNLNALRFYQKRGLRLVAVHRNAIERSRQFKPQIPRTGFDGIPIRDEIELELRLD